MKKAIALLCVSLFASSVIAKTDGSNDMVIDEVSYDSSFGYVPDGSEGEFVFTEHDYLSLISSKMGYKFIPGECDLSSEVSMADTGTIRDHLMEMGYLIGEGKEIFVMVEDKEILVKCPD